MKKSRIRQIVILAGAFAVCRAQIMGCYPLVPAYFTAAVLEDVNAVWLTAVMYLGMLSFMPLTAMVKYAVALVVITGAVKLVQWANEGCPSFLGGILSAVVTMILSFCGGLLEWRDQPEYAAVILEGILIFGTVILLNRMIHMFMEIRPAEKQEKEERKNTEREEKLAGYAESFEGLSRVFSDMSRRKADFTAEELGNIQNELTGKICMDCESCAVCWERDATPLYGMISNMIASIIKTGAFEEESERQLSLYCRKSKDMVEEAVRVFEKANLNRAWYNRLLENRQTIAEQLDAMAYIMKDCAKEETSLDGSEKRRLAELRYLAKEAGIVTENLHIWENANGHREMEVRMRSRMGGCIPVRTFLAASGHAFGWDFRTTAENKSFISKEASDYLFYEDVRFRSVQGIARIKKDGAQISGDNFSFQEFERGNLLLGLSDGMGSGSAACKESEMVLDLVEKFLDAGFSVDTAIKMMNSAMIMKGENDLYSTMDLCMVDLYSGDADFYKIGAAASFRKRGGEVELFQADSLPVGTGVNPEVVHEKTRLKNGDFIVMVTDGVLEYLHVPKPEETMQEIIESIRTCHPGVMAKKILERVLLFTGGKALDDMTVLAACIWEKTNVG